MGEQRQRYNKKFKEETVKYVQASRKSLTDIAEELNIPPGTLQKWLGQYRQFKDEAFVGSGHLRPEDQAQKDLEKRIKDLEEENAILKKAMHYFTKDPK